MSGVNTPLNMVNCFVSLWQDVIGKALSRIGDYESLDNTRQVVALINDVRTLRLSYQQIKVNKAVVDSRLHPPCTC